MFIQALRGAILAGLLIFNGLTLHAAPYAAMVIDARNGKVLHSRNADTRLHPASLTKMMTLYVVFDAIERGELSLRSTIRISKHAAAQPPSKLGLRAGQKISLTYLIRAASVKSANDAATALGEAISGTEAAFARRMTLTARKLGMSRTTFKNANGLTASGHLSTARDMTTLGRRLFFDFPRYYNLFSRRSADAGIKTVLNTNRRLLASYKGADGIKTGYTRAAGFNLVASAERGKKRVIATVFGGQTSSSRNKRVAELLDYGFKKSPKRVRTRRPGRINLASLATPKAKAATTVATAATAAKSVVKRTVRTAALTTSIRPRQRILTNITPAKVQMVSVQPEEILVAVITAQSKSDPMRPRQKPAQLAAKVVAPKSAVTVLPVSAAVVQPRLRPRNKAVANAAVVKPKIRLAPSLAPSGNVRVVTRDTNSGSRHWAVQIGAFNSRGAAEKTLLQTALREIETLDGAIRQIDYASVQGHKKFRARFVGLSQSAANKACARMQARKESCRAVAPGT